MALIDEIRACPPALLDTRDTQAIADHLNAAGRTVLVPGTFMGEGLVLAQLGFDDGSAVLDRFEAVAAQVPAMARALRMLQGSKLDIGLQVTRDAVAALVPAGVMSAAQLDQLLAPAVQAAPVSEYEVRCACFADNGDWIP
ncbi:MAG: hypothetical protein PGN26_14545 [Xylophilus ampelinus]